MNMLRKLRISVATIIIIAATLLFFDFTGTVHHYLGWIANTQFLPAVLALNVGIVIGLIALTLLFGRLYCSVICPFGILQDIVSGFSSKSKKRKYRFQYSPAKDWLRYGVLGIFVLAFLFGIGSVVALLEPYSAYGRIASNLFTPLYQWGNNLLAYIAERNNSYAFYRVDVWMKSIGTFAIATITLIVVSVLAWKNGRSYCNTICPVGTILGFISRFSFYKHQIDTESCNHCGLCARNCKASCIDSKNHSIDYSRCVTCFDCIDQCSKHAIKFRHKKVKKATNEANPVSSEQIDEVRRNMLMLGAGMMATSVVKSQGSKMDGGLAFLEDKKIPKRQTPIVPPGAHSLRNFSKRCTGCQLCVSVCPNQLLSPSMDLETFMQPRMSYERGYCRPECTKCSEVCSSGAIEKITRADKSSIQIGHAIWVKKNCVVITDDVDCGNCARHCPTGAIQMIGINPDDFDSKKVPMVDTERCIGCGACENLCPARPFSAIYVEGHLMHRTV